MKDKPSLSFYTNIPTPYQQAFFKELSYLFGLTVIYYSATENNREWNLSLEENYKIILLRNNIIGKIFQKVIVDFHFSSQIFSTVIKDKSDCIIVGGSYWVPNAIVALCLNKIKGKKICYFSEPLFIVTSRFKYYMKWVCLRVLNITCDAILCVGKKAVESFNNYNVSVLKFVVPYNIDSKKFAELNPIRKNTFLETYKNNNEIIILYSGSLIPRKGVDILIKAIKEINYTGLKFLILGNGPQKDELMELAGSDQRIIFAGFQEPIDIPYFFSIADMFAFASRYDGWAVVINEAIAANIPIISSNMVGAAIELITTDELGLLCESDNVEEFKTALEALIFNKDKRISIKNNMQQLIPFISSDWNAKLVYEIFTLHLN